MNFTEKGKTLIEKIKSLSLLYIKILAGLLFISSCSDNTFDTTSFGETYIYLAGINSKVYSGTDIGDEDDYIVNTLRILAFDKSNETLESNVYYNAHNEEVIRHLIKSGSYTLVFIANEPDLIDIKTVLDNITHYSDLSNIAFPASSFSSKKIIPMVQVISDVEVLADGTGVQINGGSAQSIITLSLIRMAARIDVDLKAEEDLSESFKGISLSGIPNVVPLFPLTYTGTINRTGSRTYTLADDSEYFTEKTSVAGYEWGMQIARIIIPSNDFTPSDDADNAIALTVNLEDKYSPTTKLKIEDTPTSNYTLPHNTKLSIDGVVKMPLELNITVEPWSVIDEDWDVGIRKLNVSSIKANITDFNGVRISFWSNMQNVRVLPNVTDVSSGTQMETNHVFNDLAVTADSPTPLRFYYDKNTGLGYMDILVDGGKSDISLNQPRNSTYKLILSAEDDGGLRSLQREITINVTQNGTRPTLNPWANGYVGAFYRNNEKGERIITAQHLTNKEWYVRVPDEYADFITISSTPSFDPGVGTDNPDNPEKYLVTPNSNRYESGTEVRGKGRIYFRVGLKSENMDTAPRYGVLEITYCPEDNPNSEWMLTDYIYIRQGEEADYIYKPSDIITEGELSGKSRTAARRFVPYNLTSPSLKNGNETASSILSPKGAVFVDYPTQAGAFFVWATEDEDLLRKAYHPTKNISETDWPDPIPNNSGFWDNEYKPTNEISPDGYSRPSDGYEDQKAVNGKYNVSGSPDPQGDYSQQIEYSQFRVSLFAVPEAGNGFSQGVSPTYPGSSNNPGGTSSSLEGTKGGIYADGFYDRRPITYNAVSRTNANIAYNGLLIFNKNTKASLFFPAAGRRQNNNRDLEYNGETGYYWSSSIGPWYSNAQYPTWRMAFNYWNIGPSSEISNFGQSIRCVKSE